MIYNIALVDDESNIADQLEEWIGQYAHEHGLEVAIKKFSTTSQFISGGFNDYHIIFMDINLPNDINGIKTAKKLRAAASKAIIIFCTNYAQYALSGYEVGALSYLIKPVKRESFERSMDRAVKALRHQSIHKMIIRTLDGQKFINVSDIIYVEVMVHNLYFHVRCGESIITERTRGVLSDIEGKLANMDFSRCSACYLVNLAHVTGVTCKDVRLDSGETLTLSRKYAKDFKERLMRYIAEYGIIDG